MPGKRTRSVDKKKKRTTRRKPRQYQRGGRNAPYNNRRINNENIPYPEPQLEIEMQGAIDENLQIQIVQQMTYIIAELHDRMYENGNPSEYTLESRNKIMHILEEEEANNFSTELIDLEDSHVSNNEDIQNAFNALYNTFYNFHHYINLEYENDEGIQSNLMFYSNSMIAPLMKAGFLPTNPLSPSPLLRPLLFQLSLLLEHETEAVKEEVQEYITSRFHGPAHTNSEVNALELPTEIKVVLKKISRLFSTIHILPNVIEIVEQYI